MSHKLNCHEMTWPINLCKFIVFLTLSGGFMSLAESHFGQNDTLARDSLAGKFGQNDLLAKDTLARDSLARETVWPVSLWLVTFWPVTLWPE